MLDKLEEVEKRSLQRKKLIISIKKLMNLIWIPLSKE